MIIVRTPVRISFFGGGSDYPIWYKQHGGAVLGVTIDKYCWLCLQKPPKDFGSRYKIVYSKMETASSIAEIEHPVVREALEDLYMPGPKEGLELYHTSDLPARSGVGSSSAFVVGLIKGLTILYKEELRREERDDGCPTCRGDHKVWDKKEVAKEAVFLEQERLHETVGSQDQYLCSYGGFNYIEFPREGDPVVKPVFWSNTDAWLCGRVLEKKLLLLWTGVQRTASDVAAGYVNDLSYKSIAIQGLVQMAVKGLGLLRDIANGKDPDPLGDLLDRAWCFKKLIGNGITTTEIDTYYRLAKENGALGGKILGAGGGGFLLLYVPEEKRDRVKQALGLLEVPFRFEHQGCQVVFEGCKT